MVWRRSRLRCVAWPPAAAGAAGDAAARQRDDLPLLAAEALLLGEGMRCVSLGVQVAVADIAMAADQLQAAAVVPSFAAALSPKLPSHSMEALREALPPATPLWVIGELIPRLTARTSRRHIDRDCSRHCATCSQLARHDREGQAVTEQKVRIGATRHRYRSNPAPCADATWSGANRGRRTGTM